MADSSVCGGILLISLFCTLTVNCDASCPDKKFGWKCKFDCRCADDKVCDKVTGACSSGCKTGFYGANCIYSNNCFYDSYGVNYTGTLDTVNESKCLPWKGKPEFTSNRFADGVIPENYCRNPKNSKNSTNFFARKPWCYIEGAKPSFQYCNLSNCTCIPGFFGDSCLFQCHCKNIDEVCSSNGHCKSGCAFGWTGHNCQTGCQRGRYGDHCKDICGDCKDDLCNPENGLCTKGCKPGYVGLNCTEKCEKGFFGHKCSQVCGKCKYLETQTCNFVDGNCRYGCENGYKSPTCKENCSPKYYGQNCKSLCGHCLNSGNCNPVTGHCDNGCSAGWQLPECYSECPSGSYGENCNMTCSSCVDGKPCDHITGQCLAGCRSGYRGATCVESVSGDMKLASTVGAVIAALITFILVVAFVFFIFRRKQRNKTNGKILVAHSRDIIDQDPPETSKETDPFILRPSLQGNGQTVLNIANDMTERTVEEPFYVNVNTKIQNSPVKLEDLYDYIQKNKENNNAKFKMEFKQLPDGLLAMCSFSRKHENFAKNRYKNIVAYDHSRVVLDIIDGDPSSDYINASFLDGYRKEKAYIASQGPNKAMLKDFWRMVWQKKICKIVMLTDLVEACKKKCEQYWPDEGINKYGEVSVEIVDTARFTDYAIRTFKLTKNEKSRIVKHFHFTTWPDHSAPTYPTTLLIFKRKIQMYNPDSTSPILIHCSAGSGRTGTFIALDWSLQQAKAEKIVDVLGCAQLMRTNRVNMIQNLDQYIFVYDGLLEAIKAGETTILKSSFSQTYQKMCHINPETFRNVIEEQFHVLHLLCIPLQRDDCTAALANENLCKNRFKNILPANRCRPFLYTQIDGCNDYINAVFLPGYTRRVAYIVTQMPLPSTLADFWRMLYDHHSDTVVMLNEFDRNDKSCALYWPEEYGYPLEHGALSVELLSSSETDPNVAVRVFKLSHTGKGEDRAIKQFQFKSWLDYQKLPTSPTALLRLYQMVSEWQQQNGKGPVTVHCMNGSSRSGLFCAVSLIFERMKVDREVDVFQTVKQIRINRPQFIEDIEQYEFCYKVVQDYLLSE